MIKNMEINIPNIAILTENPLAPWEQRIPKICTDLAIYPKKQTSSEEYIQYFRQHKHKTDVDIYTDGSKSKDGVGAGMAIRDKKRQMHRNEIT